MQLFTQAITNNLRPQNQRKPQNQSSRTNSFQPQQSQQQQSNQQRNYPPQGSNQQRPYQGNRQQTRRNPQKTFQNRQSNQQNFQNNQFKEDRNFNSLNNRDNSNQNPQYNNQNRGQNQRRQQYNNQNNHNHAPENTTNRFPPQNMNSNTNPNFDRNFGGHRSQNQNRESTPQNRYNQSRESNPPNRYNQSRQSNPPSHYNRNREDNDHYNQNRGPNPPSRYNQKKQENNPPDHFNQNRDQYQNKNKYNNNKMNMSDGRNQSMSNYRGRGRGRGRMNNQRNPQQRYQHFDEKKSVITEQKKQERSQKFKPRNSTQNQQLVKRFPRPEESNNTFQQKKPFQKEKKQQQQQEQMSAEEEVQYSDEEIQEESGEQNQSEDKYQEQQNEEDEGSYSGGNQEQQSEQIRISKKPQKFSLDYSNQQPRATDKMCGDHQYQERLTFFKQSNPQLQSAQKSDFKNIKLNLDTGRSFTIFEINKDTYHPDPALCLKRFRRSAAREEDNNSDQEQGLRRSIKGLKSAMNYIIENVIDSDRKKQTDLPFPFPFEQKRVQFLQIYQFLWDRMRQMVKDITRLSEQQKMAKPVIIICQQITRFFILAFDEGRKKQSLKLGFDEKMNRESLTKILTPLMDIYIASRFRLKKLINKLREKSLDLSFNLVNQKMKEEGIYISPNQAEITAYAIVFSNDFEKYLYENVSNAFSPHQQNPLYDSPEITQALMIQKALKNNNFQKYYEILEQPSTDYVMASMMLYKIQSVRKEAFKTAYEAFKYLDTSKGAPTKGIQQSFLQKILHFKPQQKKQFQAFLYYMDAFKNKQGYIVIEEGEVQKNYQNSSYIFDSSKLSRVVYGNTQPPASAQRVLHKQSQITRRQLVQRSWYQSNYINLLICSYLRIEPSQSNEIKIGNIYEQDKSVYHQKKQKININEKSENQPQKLQAFREAALARKLKSDERKKFIGQFINLLVDVLTPNQVRQKQQAEGLVRLINIGLKIKHRNFIDAFIGLKDNMTACIQDELWLLKVEHHTQSVKYFESFYNKSNYEYSNRTNQNSVNCGISALINKKSKKCTGNSRHFNRSILRETLQRLKECGNIKGAQLQQIKGGSSSKKQEFVLKILAQIPLGLDEKNSLNKNKNEEEQSMRALLRKIIKNILGEILGTDEELDLNTPYSVKFYNLTIKIRVQTIRGLQDWKKVFGADCIIFVDLFKSQQNFANIMKQIVKIKEQVKSQYLGYVGAFTFFRSTEPMKMVSHSSYAEIQSPQYLVGSSINLSSMMIGKIQKLLEHSIRYRLIKPALQTREMSYFLRIIYDKSAYLQKAINIQTKFSEKIFYYNEYFNMCLQQLLQMNRAFHTECEVFANWPQILQKIKASFQQINLTQAVEIMKTELKDLKTLINKLKLKTPYEEQSKHLIQTRQSFAKFYAQYLKQFDYNSLLDLKELDKEVDLLDLQSGQVYGDYQLSVFNYLINILSYNFEQFLIVAPKNFEFKICMNTLQSRVQQKLSSLKMNKSIASIKSRQKDNYDFSWKMPIGEQISQSPSRQYIGQIEVRQDKRIKNNQYDLKQKEQMTVSKRGRPNSTFIYPRAEWLTAAKKKIKTIQDKIQ